MAEQSVSQDQALRYRRLTFYASDVERINEFLLNFVKKSGARSCLVVDRDGHMVAKQGFLDGINTANLSALVAGSFASTGEVARQLGETHFHDIMHQGDHVCIHISLVGERSLQVAVFQSDVKPGIIQVMTRELNGKLGALLEDIATRQTQGKPEESLAENFSKDMKDQLDNLFGDL